ncbi:MAG: HAMP domain-containing histidine kinase [Clostridiales bacterium]|nr:HAMP domain-containing histidine kinase [Clostridiales bacterium]
MEQIVIIVLSILLLGTLIKNRLQKRNLKALTKEFEILLREEGNGELHLGSPSSDMEKFVEVVNHYLEKTKENQLAVEKKEQQLKDEIANISHDLRTPLTSMKGYLRLLKETQEEKEREEYLGVIQRKTEQLQELIEQLYEYTSVKDRVQSVKLEQVELYSFFCNQVLNYYQNFEEKGIEVQLPEEKSYSVMADVNALNRVFGNLIGNALKYGKDFWQIGFADAGGRIQMIFKDPAEKLTEEDVEHLFDRFYMQEESRTLGGSGLGLTIAKMFMETMEGDMEAELEEACLKIILTFKKI